MDYRVLVKDFPATAFTGGVTRAGGTAICNELVFSWSDDFQCPAANCTFDQSELFQGVGGFQIVKLSDKSVVRETFEPDEETADLSEDLGSSDSPNVPIPAGQDNTPLPPQEPVPPGDTTPAVTLTDEQWLEGFITTFKALTPEARRSTIPTKKVFLKADFTRACALLKIVAEDKIEAMVSALESFLGLSSDTPTA
jgi:hypothetical protein